LIRGKFPRQEYDSLIGIAECRRAQNGNQRKERERVIKSFAGDTVANVEGPRWHKTEYNTMCSPFIERLSGLASSFPFKTPFA